MFSKIEKGERNLTDRMITDICREYHINETWLRTGEGEMLIPSDEYFKNIADEVTKDPMIREVITRYFKLSDDNKDKFWELLHALTHDLPYEHLLKGVSIKQTDLYPDIPKTPEEFEAKYPPVDPAEVPDANKKKA